MIGTLADSAGPSLRTRTDSLECAAFVNHDSLDDDIAIVQLTALVWILCLPVSHSTLDKFLKRS